MNEWIKGYLNNFIKIGNGNVRPGNHGNIPIYGGNGILDYCDSYNYTGETIIIGRVGAYCGSTYYVNRSVWISDNALSIKVVDGDTKFMYYYLKNMNLNMLAEGSTQPLLTHKLINSLEVIIPTQKIQEIIASILSSLDDKIDILRRQNVTLESMAEALFIQWFIVEAQDDWEIGCLEDAITFYDNKRVPLSSLQRDNMKIGKLYPYYGAAKIMDYINEYIFDGDYLLIAEDGSVQDENGYPIIQRAVGKFWVNNHTHIIQAKSPYNNNFIYISLINKSITEIVTGAVQPKISQSNLQKLPFIKYPENLVNKFIIETNPLFNKILLNRTQIHTLEKLRDTLLPKLMSGEIRVKCDE